MKTKSFLLSVVLTITTDRMLCQMGDIYGILNHVTGDELFTHVLPRASRFAKPIILEKYPELLKITDDNLKALTFLIGNAESPKHGVDMWLDLVCSESHLNCPVDRMFEIDCYADSWLSFNPVDELVSMVGEDKVVKVTL